MTDEEFYDKEIAPELLALSRQCQERGMAFLAAVEFNTPESGVAKTFNRTKPITADMSLTYLATCACGNFDQLAITAARLNSNASHQSFVLSLIQGKETPNV